MSTVKYVKPIYCINNYGVSRTSLQKWALQGKIRFITTPGGGRCYLLQDIKNLFDVPDSQEDNKKIVLYARVSSSKQNSDLKRQIETLQKEYKDFDQEKITIIKDTASGLNYNRQGLISLLDKVNTGLVKEVVVTDRDRLARYGIELIEYIFSRNDVKLHVLSCPEVKNETEELAQDLLSICNYFVAKNNGRRASRNRKCRLQQQDKVGNSSKGKTNSNSASSSSNDESLQKEN